MRGRVLVLSTCVSALGAAVWLGCGSEPAPAAVDASVPSDAKSDVTPPMDAAGDGCTPGCGSLCESFVPVAVGNLVEAGACTNPQIDGFRIACFDAVTDGGDGGACTAFRAANGACAACLAPGPDASVRGVLVNPVGTLIDRVNVAGCLAKTSADAACGASAEQPWACAEYYCLKVCPSPPLEGDPPSFKAYGKCISDALKTVCSSWTKSACSPADAGPTAACGGSDFAELFTNVARLMCGVADAGGD